MIKFSTATACAAILPTESATEGILTVTMISQISHAWVLLSEKPEYEQLRYDAFAKPKWLHHDDFRPVLKRQPVGIDESTELFVEVEFDVLENEIGRAHV